MFDERSLPALASVLVPGCAGGRHCADCYRGAATVLAGRLATGGGYCRDRFLSMVGATLTFDPLRHNTALAAAAIASHHRNRLLLSIVPMPSISIFSPRSFARFVLIIDRGANPRTGTPPL